MSGELLANVKKELILGQAIFFWGAENGMGFTMQTTSLELIRKYQTDWFKTPLQGEAKTSIKLVIKFWFGDSLRHKWLHFDLFLFQTLVWDPVGIEFKDQQN